MPVALVPSVKAHRITRQQTPHHCSQTYVARTKQKMGMIWHQCPSITTHPCIRQDQSQPVNNVVPVLVVQGVARSAGSLGSCFITYLHVSIKQYLKAAPLSLRELAPLLLAKPSLE
jgi:hypothetical protein